MCYIVEDQEGSWLMIAGAPESNVGDHRVEFGTEKRGFARSLVDSLWTGTERFVWQTIQQNRQVNFVEWEKHPDAIPGWDGSREISALFIENILTRPACREKLRSEGVCIIGGIFPDGINAHGLDPPRGMKWYHGADQVMQARCYFMLILKGPS